MGKNEVDLLYKELSYEIRGAAIEVKTILAQTIKKKHTKELMLKNEILEP